MTHLELWYFAHSKLKHFFNAPKHNQADVQPGFFSAWLNVLQCSKHHILGAERSASAHDTAPSWNSSKETTYWERRMRMAPDGANSFWVRSTDDVPAATAAMTNAKKNIMELNTTNLAQTIVVLAHGSSKVEQPKSFRAPPPFCCTAA